MSTWNDTLIDAMPSPGDIRDAERSAACARVRHRLEDIRDSYATLAAQDRAAITGSSGQRVAVTKVPPIPINVDLADLTRRLRPLDPAVVRETAWPEDQIGHLAVASELLFWVRDWAEQRGESVPLPIVYQLSLWLADRLEWAWESHGAWNEMATAVERVARALYGTLTPREGRSVPVSAPCPREGCEGPLSRRDDGWVECGADECGRILSAAEYIDWSGMVIARLAHDMWGISAKEISLRHGKPMGTVHRLAHKHAWRRTGKEHRPVMYDKRQVETTMALVAEREAEMAKVA